MFPLAPKYAKILVMANQNGLLPYACLLVAILSVREPLISVYSLRFLILFKFEIIFFLFYRFFIFIQVLFHLNFLTYSSEEKRMMKPNRKCMMP